LGELRLAFVAVALKPPAVAPMMANVLPIVSAKHTVVRDAIHGFVTLSRAVA
jgi:hypothetical protein